LAKDKNGNSFKPSDWDLVNPFRENHLSLSENKETEMVILSVRSKSPNAAQNWTEHLVADINEYMRDKDISEAEIRITYLESKLKTTKIAGMQKVFLN